MTLEDWRKSGTLHADWAGVINSPLGVMMMGVLEQQALKVHPVGTAEQAAAAHHQNTGWLRCLEMMREMSRPPQKHKAPMEATFGAEQILQEQHSTQPSKPNA